MLKIITYCCLATLLFAGQILAQTPQPETENELKKFEVGVQATAINISDPLALNVVNPLEAQSRNEVGFGGRFTYNVNRFLALEAEVNLFPRDYTIVRTWETGGRVTQALVGVKTGYRFKRVGIFGKFRPGAAISEKASVADFPDGDGPDPRNPFGFRDIRAAQLTMDVGGVFEYYPTRRTIFRVDAGDTITRYTDIPFVQFRGAGGVPVVVDVYTHKPQVSIGVGFRF